MNEAQIKRKQQAKKNNRQVKFYYSFLTIVLLICLIQVVRSAVLNIIKTANYKVKVRKMMVLREEVQAQHERLESDIKNFGNLKSLEAIARNNLKMAGQDEVLVIINQEREKNIIEEQEVPESDEPASETTPEKPTIWQRLSLDTKFQKK